VSDSRPNDEQVAEAAAHAARAVEHAGGETTAGSVDPG
jgi:hypothetical protein